MHEQASKPTQITVNGTYFDGHSAASHPVTLSLDEQGLLHLDPTHHQPIPLDEITIGSRIGSTPRRLEFPDGGLVETGDHRSIEQWQRSTTKNGHYGWIHRLESSIAYGAGALLFIIALILVSLMWGIPWSSNLIAHALPEDITQTIGDSAVESLDQLIFSSSELDPQRYQQLQLKFQQLLTNSNNHKGYRLEFRHGGVIGANAFAFPNGLVVMTDEMVELADLDEELLSIFLHEIGHLEQRHSLRQIIAHSSLAILTTLLTGDITAASSLVVGAPNLLMKASYSREMETEADTYALIEMERLQLATEHFANIMDRLEFAMVEAQSEVHTEPTDPDPDDENSEESWLNKVELLDFFSSHPLTEQRTARFRQGKPAPLPTPTAITDSKAYPVDFIALRQHLNKGQYQQLHRQLDHHYQQFLSGDGKAEIIADKAYNLLCTFTPETQQQLEQWAVEMPGSYVAQYALGIYNKTLVSIRRDGRYWRHIPEQDRVAMENHTKVAETHFLNSLKIQPDFTLAQASLYSLASFSRYDDTDEETLITEALKTNPASYILNRTKLFYLQPRWGGSYPEINDALKGIHKQIQQNPELAALTGVIFHYKALDYDRNQHYRGTVRLESAAINRGHKSWYFANRADAFSKLDEPELALIDYNNAIQLFPEDPQLYIDRSSVLRDLRQLESARQDIETVLTITPYDEDALETLANFQIKAGNHQTALGNFQKILVTQPGNANAHFRISKLLTRDSGQQEAALQASHKAIQFGDDSPHYWYQYAYLTGTAQNCAFPGAAKTYLRLCQNSWCSETNLRWVKQKQTELAQQNLCANSQ
ncbi:MAG: M48 family metalloprotease [Immundisolibacteraceae bacterium]|nr:M48 family metalloprotease [Immundisolibacteraceae bacterium]